MTDDQAETKSTSKVALKDKIRLLKITDELQLWWNRSSEHKDTVIEFIALAQKNSIITSAFHLKGIWDTSKIRPSSWMDGDENHELYQLNDEDDGCYRFITTVDDLNDFFELYYDHF